MRYEFLADPYVLPEPIGGFDYMIANCVITGRPTNQRGAIGLYRSHSGDGMNWEGVGILTPALDLDRAETPCLWNHGNRWYLYYGGTLEGELYSRENYLFEADSIFGSYSPLGKMRLPDDQPFYIGKPLTSFKGEDKWLCCIGEKAMSLPYSIEYSTNSGMQLHPPEASISLA